MTIPSRPHHDDQASLSALGGEAIGWDYHFLAANLVLQQWDPQTIKY